MGDRGNTKSANTKNSYNLHICRYWKTAFSWSLYHTNGCWHFLRKKKTKLGKRGESLSFSPASRVRWTETGYETPVEWSLRAAQRKTLRSPYCAVWQSLCRCIVALQAVICDFEYEGVDYYLCNKNEFVQSQFSDGVLNSYVGVQKTVQGGGIKLLPPPPHLLRQWLFY